MINQYEQRDRSVVLVLVIPGDARQHGGQDDDDHRIDRDGLRGIQRIGLFGYIPYLP